MRRRAGLIALLLIAVNGQLLQSAERSNILLICVDDLKPAVGCYGDRLAKTPHLDRLATRGVRFDAAYCNQAVCSPSRNALMTSLRPQTLGIYDLGTNFRMSAPDAVTVAQHFKAHGYRTEAMGKIFHTGHGNQEDERSWSMPHWRPRTASYVLPSSNDNTIRRPDGRMRGPATESADVSDDAYADGQIAAEAVQRIEAAAKRDKPFFIAVGFLKPHLPFVAPKRYWDLYDPAEFGWDLYDPAEFELPQVNSPPAGAPSYAPTSWGELRNYSDMPNKGPLDDETTRHLIHGYYAATSYADAQIGRLLDALDDNNLSANTIVVLWGDHGWHLGDHGMWCKHSNYEQAARIPVIIAAPSSARGKSTAALIETVDIYPTLCELTQLAAPSGLDGVSFAGTLEDPEQPARTSVIHVYPRNQVIGRAIRTDRYRLVEWKQPGAHADSAELELYDYAEDPLETRNLASELPEVVAELRATLAKHPEAKRRRG